ncbi:invasion associated locus B family protein [Ruegeria sediminis]|nr:invasion associated locus B family protein [Ruegeria sediminis]
MRKKWIWVMALVSLSAACVKRGSEDSDHMVRSHHGAWSVLCSDAHANCIANLPVEDMTGKQILSISGYLLPENEKAVAAGFNILIPARMSAPGRPDLTVNKAAGLLMSVDHRVTRRYSIENCKPDYCVVNVGVKRRLLRALETGKTARLTLVYSGSEERTEEFQVPLPGLAEALNAAG